MPAHQPVRAEPAVSDLVRRARSRRDKGRLDQAERLYAQALAADPQDGEAAFGFGTVAALQGRHADAVPRLAGALKLDPTRAERWFALAEALLAQDRVAEMRALMGRFADIKWPDPAVPDGRSRFVSVLLGHAIRHHDARRLDRAEALYDVALLLDAGNPDALVLAGNAALDGGRLDLAASLAELALARAPGLAGVHQLLARARHRQGLLAEAAASFAEAVAIAPDDPQALNNLASTLQDLGRPAEAEEHLRRALALRPGYALGWNNLGLALADLGRHGEAIEAYGRATAIEPGFAAAHCHLGLALAAIGDGPGAERCFREAIGHDPAHAFARNNLGNLLREDGRLDEALAELEEAARLRPDVADIHSNLGTTLMALDRVSEAKAALLEAVRLKPEDANLHFNLGNCFSREFRFQPALEAYKAALDARPAFVEALNNVADAYRVMTLLSEAETVLRRAIALDPDYLAAHNNLGNLLKTMGRLDEAAETLETAVALAPGRPETQINLAMVYRELGRREDARAAYEAARRCRIEAGTDLQRQELMDGLDGLRELTRPDADGSIRTITSMAAYSHNLFQRLYRTDVSPQEQAGDARVFGARFCDPLHRATGFGNDRDPARRLRLGFLSADFRQHSVLHFFEPVLRHLDRGQFELFAYSNTILVDEATDRLQAEFDHWLCVRRLADDTVAERIEADGIDILVDLSGHTAGNRLGVMARKPAPVQVSWLGYPGTIGMRAIDYRFADVTEPEGESDRLSVERLWRLPRISIGYQPHPLAPEPVDHPPSERNGFVTFGSFNNYAKLTDDTLATWGEILGAVPGSRLLLEIANIGQPRVREEIETRLARLGLPLDRLDFEDRTPRSRFVLYNRVDVALDPFPYNGGTTSMDTLWMGVPFVTLEGGHLVARIGYSILDAMGLAALAAPTRDEYVRIASALATDAVRLRSVRQGLRARMAASPLMDHAGLAAAIGDALRGMWRRWTAEPDDAALSLR